MSTGPGPTRKDDGSDDASVDDIADLLVEEESHPVSVKHDSLLDKSLDDGLDVMLETPGPVLASTFLPPPPAPAGLAGEEGDSVEESGAATNLAYEDLLAKLVLPAKAPEPEATLPVPETLPLSEALSAPAGSPFSEPVLPSIQRPSSPSLLAAPPADERTLVTDNPLVAEEQEAAVREGRISAQPRIQDEMHPTLTEPLGLVGGVAKSKLLYLSIAGLLILLGSFLATIVLRLLLPTPAVQAPPVAAPAAVPQPTPAPPAQVQQLPPTPPVAAPAAAPAAEASEPAEAKPAAAPAAEEDESALDGEKAQARAHRREAHRVARPAPTPKPTAAPKAAAAKPAASAPAPAAQPAKPLKPSKPSKPSTKGKASSYADPFDN
jgi:hypothetical protein